MIFSPPTADAPHLAARLKVLEDHVQAENLRNVDAIMDTYGAEPRFDDEPLHEHRQGRGQVRSFYEVLLSALPDLTLQVQQKHVTEDAIIVEFLVSGTHDGVWRGLPPTGRKVEFPLCAVHMFDDTHKIAGERIYYDLATVYEQVGLLHNPQRGFGRVITAVTHPVTIANGVLRHTLSAVLGGIHKRPHASL